MTSLQSWIVPCWCGWWRWRCGGCVAPTSVNSQETDNKHRWHYQGYFWDSTTYLTGRCDDSCVWTQELAPSRRKCGSIAIQNKLASVTQKHLKRGGENKRWAFLSSIHPVFHPSMSVYTLRGLDDIVGAPPAACPTTVPHSLRRHSKALFDSRAADGHLRQRSRWVLKGNPKQIRKPINNWPVYNYVACQGMPPASCPPFAVDNKHPAGSFDKMWKPLIHKRKKKKKALFLF